MATKQPNILILWGDDIGIWNISHFSKGQMGYRTPNIDRAADEGCSLTDSYRQQCAPLDAQPSPAKPLRLD
jgi:arylsulfatase